MVGRLEHLPDGVELVFPEQLLTEEIRGKLDGYLPDIATFTGSVLPYVLEILRTYQHEIEVSDGLHAVPDDSLYAAPVLHEIQLEFPVAVQRICELGLVPLDDVETVHIGEVGDFCEYFAHCG